MTIHIPPAPTAHLHTQLEEKAATDGAAVVSYRIIDSPVGQLLLARTERGVVRVAFEREGEEAVLQDLADQISPRILRAPKQLDGAARWLDAYLSGSVAPMALSLDPRLLRGYRGEVLMRLREVGYGDRISYRDLARQTSSPRAVRAVGTACATNPLPLLIPCHRVVRSDGGLGGYLGGVEVKQYLLALESAARA